MRHDPFAPHLVLPQLAIVSAVHFIARSVHLYAFIADYGAFPAARALLSVPQPSSLHMPKPAILYHWFAFSQQLRAQLHLELGFSPTSCCTHLHLCLACKMWCAEYSCPLERQPV